MIVMPRYVLPPYVCYHCRTDRVPTVYTQREDEDARGPNAEHIYFCFECLLHAAREVAPLTGHKVVTVALLDGMESAIAAATHDAEVARHERDLALTARDSIVASLNANPAAVEGDAVEVEVEMVPARGDKRWRK